MLTRSGSFMKYWYNFLCFLILTSFASYGQNVYQHFSELNGMEDYNGNTNLLFRISSSRQDLNNGSFDNSIYLLNVVNKIDSLFQVDASYYDYIGSGWRTVDSYDFWEKNPLKYIVCGSSGGIDGSHFVERFDGRNIRMPLFVDGGFIGISRQNDSLVYSTFNAGLFYRSTDGGVSWDTAGHFNAFSLSPYNDKVLFSIQNDGLNKTTDGGLTKHVVDTIPANGYNTNSLFYDKDTNYIYRVAFYYPQNYGVYKLLVSNNSGEAYSWRVKFTSTSLIYLSVDNTVAGSVYFATDKYIYHSTDFGNTFSLIQKFDRSLVGFYKKPGSSKLYAAAYNTIYEIDGSAINIIKQIPIDPEIFKFDPINIGNKWIYKTGPTTNPGIGYKEVLKDTVLANKKTFRQIESININSLSKTVSYTYERIDSVTGDVYGWGNDSTEYIIDNLNHNPGDIINASRFYRAWSTFFDSLKTISLFNLPTETRVYSIYTPYGGDHYYLAKNFGISYLQQEFEAILIINELKGAVIKGIVYGDTSNIVGINDIYPTPPDKFVLSQNYPNPFNPTTTINYSIPKAGNVKLTIFDAIGSKVANIVNEYKPAGNYSVKFTGTNLASGIYLYRLESGNYSATKKFVLLK
jgi:Secretion system C-terminal sorting domain